MLSIVFVFLNTRIDANVSLSKDVHWHLAKYFYGFKKMFSYAYEFWTHKDFSNVKIICSLLATIILTLSIAPCKDDIKHLFSGIAIIAGTLYSLNAFGLPLAKIKWLNYFVYKLWDFTTAGLCTLTGFLFITFIIIAVVKGIKLVSGR